MSPTSAGPLSGVRVVDLTMWIQGPIAATLLADMGADVIKVEKAGMGDHGRFLTTLYGVDVRRGDAPNLLWTMCNRNKRGLALDLRHEKAKPVFEALVRGADVLVTNLLPGPLADFGADETAVRALNPRIVYARAAGFGELGPRAEDPCQDTVGMAYAGFLWTCSNDGERPYYPPGAMSDQLSGTMMAFGVLGALLERARTGEGQYVATSQLQAMMWMQSLNIGAAANLGQPFEVSDRVAPPNPMFNTYRCGDGRWIALGMAVPRMWGRMCRAIGLEQLIDDPRFAEIEERGRNAADAVSILDAHFLTASSEHWLERLRAGGIWVAPINKVEDLLDDEQVRANGYLLETDDGSRAPRMPFTIRGHEPGRASAPAHGQHTDAVLAELGFSEEERLALRVEGVTW